MTRKAIGRGCKRKGNHTSVVFRSAMDIYINGRIKALPMVLVQARITILRIKK